jgi:hypothetical protein
MFGCTFIDHGISSSFGNVISLEGQDGSIAEATNYGYLYQEGPDNFVDEIGEDGGTIFFKSQDSKGRAVCYSGLTDNYRAIHSTVIFGALTNGTNTKHELMNRYMNYLVELTGIEEFEIEQERISFSVFPNPVRKSANISFSLAQPGRVVASIYNTAGQLVKRLAEGTFDVGAHTLVWFVDDGRGREMSNGTYILSLETSEHVVSKPIVVLR